MKLVSATGQTIIYFHQRRENMSITASSSFQKVHQVPRTGPRGLHQHCTKAKNESFGSYLLQGRKYKNLNYTTQAAMPLLRDRGNPSRQSCKRQQPTCPRSLPGEHLCFLSLGESLGDNGENLPMYMPAIPNSCNRLSLAVSALSSRQNGLSPDRSATSLDISVCLSRFLMAGWGGFSHLSTRFSLTDERGMPCTGSDHCLMSGILRLLQLVKTTNLNATYYIQPTIILQSGAQLRSSHAF